MISDMQMAILSSAVIVNLPILGWLAIMLWSINGRLIRTEERVKTLQQVAFAPEGKSNEHRKMA